MLLNSSWIRTIAKNQAGQENSQKCFLNTAYVLLSSGQGIIYFISCAPGSDHVHPHNTAVPWVQGWNNQGSAETKDAQKRSVWPPCSHWLLPTACETLTRVVRGQQGSPSTLLLLGVMDGSNYMTQNLPKASKKSGLKSRRGNRDLDVGRAQQESWNEKNSEIISKDPARTRALYICALVKRELF